MSPHTILTLEADIKLTQFGAPGRIRTYRSCPLKAVTLPVCLQGYIGSKGGIRTLGFRDLQSLALGHSATLPLLLERDIGIEPMTEDWKSAVLPLN